MLIRLYEKNNSLKDLQQVLSVLNSGGTVIFPTDTRYAMGCHALKERAVERIFQLKNLDKKSLPSIICYNLSTISQYTKMDNGMFKLLKHNLPGPFTFILETSNRLPKIFRNRKEVGVRMPDNAIISTIAELLDAPILTTSLPYDEDEDMGYATDPELIDEKFGSQVDLIVDGGIGGMENSTVVSLVDGDPEIVRQGLGVLKY